MSKLITLVVIGLMCFTEIAFAGWVRGYSRRNGTYVNGYQRTNRNSSVYDNYSYRGNTNSYTGNSGYNSYNNSSSSNNIGRIRRTLYDY